MTGSTLPVGSAADFVPHREGNFPTPSGKCEFRSPIAAGGNMVLPLFPQGYMGDQSGEALVPPHLASRQSMHLPFSLTGS